MRLTKFSYYALRVLLYLASCPSRLATIGEIARSHSISKCHLMKVVHALGRTGFVQTVRGKGGGLRIAHSAETIALGEVLRQTETAFASVDPATRGKALGAVATSLRLHDMLDESRGAAFEILDRYTLADLAADNGSARQATVRSAIGRGASAVPAARLTPSPSKQRAERIVAL
jgi:Rrf2 family nitric oxide-sensitive transcriptional repressor